MECKWQERGWKLDQTGTEGSKKKIRNKTQGFYVDGAGWPVTYLYWLPAECHIGFGFNLKNGVENTRLTNNYNDTA